MRVREIKPVHIVRTLAAAVSLTLLVWVDCNKFTAATIIGTVVFGAAFAVCVLWKPFCRVVKRLWGKLFGKIALLLAAGVITACVVICAVFSVNMARCIEKPIEDPGAVVVLGCRVRGETPSPMLARRLDAALETLSENPDALCVVCGGKGRGEDISEADAMSRYLTERGVPEDRILAEDRSTNTRENITFAAELLKERGIDRVVIVTSEFHQYRADVYARRCGLTAGHHSCKTRVINVANYWVREWAALGKQLIMDN